MDPFSLCWMVFFTLEERQHKDEKSSWNSQLTSVNVPFRFRYICRYLKNSSNHTLFKFWTWVGFCDMFFGFFQPPWLRPSSNFFFIHFCGPNLQGGAVSTAATLLGLGCLADAAGFVYSIPWGGKLRMPVTTRRLSFLDPNCGQGKFAVQTVPSKNGYQCGLHQISPPPKKNLAFSDDKGEGFNQFQSLEGVGVLWRFNLGFFYWFQACDMKQTFSSRFCSEALTMSIQAETLKTRRTWRTIRAGHESRDV